MDTHTANDDSRTHHVNKTLRFAPHVEMVTFPVVFHAAVISVSAVLF
jgi:hypothetical protein